ncbi:MAG: sugar ABC transporter permease [Clostridiales bacterium]|nr:sugar ABC transporter permease [Clostridiales bacterium]
MQRLKRGLRRETAGYFLIAPGLLLIAVILIYPLVRGVASSFFSSKQGSLDFDQFVGLKYFAELSRDRIFLTAMRNSILYTVVVVAGMYVLGLATALLLNKQFRGRAAYRSLVLIPWVVPGIAAAMTWKWMYSSQYGVINYVLQSLGLIGKNVDWLGNAHTALGSVMVTAIWKAIPFMAITMLAALQSIDMSLYEAARVDGASSFQCFRYITFTGIKEVSITTVLLQIIWTFNQFDLVYTMTKGGPSNSSQIIPVYTYLTAFNFFKLNKAAAIGVVGLLFVGVFAVWYIIRNNRGERA